MLFRSLLTPPCPLRYVKLAGNSATVDTVLLIDKLYPGTDFAQKAEEFTYDAVVREAIEILMRYKLSEADAAYIAEFVGHAYVAHYAGDEDPALRTELDTSRLSLWGKTLYATQRYVLNGLWRDLPPQDNAVIIPLD